MIKRTVELQIGLWVLLGMLFSLAAHSADGEVEISTPSNSLEAPQGDRAVPSSIETVVNIEERVQFEESELGRDLTREYTFTATQPTLIVVYWESSDEENRGVYADLYDDEGQFIAPGNNYEKRTNFSEFRGRHRTFSLPAAGTYRLIFGAYGNYGFATDPEIDRDYLLRVRVASEYDQTMISAAELLEFELFQAALDLFSQAIEQRPEQPLPYFGRLFAQANLALEATGLSKDEVDEPTEIYGLYQSLAVDIQQQVLSDLQSAQDAILGVMESENLTEEELDIDLEYFSAIAQYFETGELPEYFEATASQAEAEPVEVDVEVR